MTEQTRSQESRSPSPAPAVESRSLNLPVFAASALVIGVVAGAAIIAPQSVQGAFDAAVDWAGRWFG